MFQINDDMTIEVTRGDAVAFSVVATKDGENYIFKSGDVVRFKVVEKKDCEVVALQKDFAVTEDTEKVGILLTEGDTRIGEVISKPTEYWYEVELNPHTNPQTILGYDNDGAKVFKLYPEGKDLEWNPEPEDIGTVDAELDMTSERPIQNQAVARKFNDIEGQIELLRDESFSVRSTIKSLVEEEIEPAIKSAEEDLEAFKDEARADLVAMTDEVVAEATEKANTSEANAKAYMNEAKGHSDDAEGFSDLAKEYMEGAFATTPEGYAEVVEKVKYMDIKTSNENTLLRSKEGGLKVVEIVGNSEQNEEPTPDTPIAIENVGEHDEESGKYVVPISVHGKNLIPFPYTHTTRTYGGTTISVEGDGLLTASGTATSTHYFTVRSVITLPKGKYKLSGCPTGGGGAKYCILLRKNGNNSDKTAVDYGNGAVFEVTDETVEYTIIICIYTGVTLANLVFKPTLCRCDENGTPYGDDTYEVWTEHAEYIYLDEPLRKGDRIVEVDGVFKVERNVAEVVYNGTETWNFATNGAGIHYVFTDKLADAKTQSLGFCNLLESYKTSVNNNNFFINHSGQPIFCGNSFASKDEWVALITETPCVIQYELATPIYEELNKESQIALNKLKTFDGVTYIDFNTTIQPSAFEVKYGSSDVGAGVLKNDDRLTKLEICLKDIPLPLLRTEWVEDNGVYKQTALVEGLKTDSTPSIMLSSVGEEATEEELNAYACLDRYEVEDGSITFIASAIPSISFTVIAKGVIASEGQAIADVTALVGRVSELESEIDNLNSDLTIKGASGTKVDVYYDSQHVYLYGFAQGVTLNYGADDTTTFILPSKVSANANRFGTGHVLDTNFYPLNTGINLVFDGNKVKMRSSTALSNAIVYFTIAYPRRFFNITE